MLFLFVVSINNIEIIFSGMIDEAGDLIGRVLEIIVHDDDIVSPRVVQACQNSSMLPKILGQTDVSNDGRVRGMKDRTNVVAIIRAPIIYQNDLQPIRTVTQDFDQSLDQWADGIGAPVNWDDYRNLHDPTWRPANFVETTELNETDSGLLASTNNESGFRGLLPVV